MASAENPSGRTVKAQSSAPVVSSGVVAAPSALYDPHELEEPGELDPDRKREVLDLFHRLEASTHYELLGVPVDADRRAIKSAYYDKVKTFHPDRYFGKNLGAFRAKLEQCFARLTAAHDTLANAESRQEYDNYLAVQRQADELERALSQSVTADDLVALEQRLDIAFQVPASPDAVAPEPNPNIGFTAECPKSDVVIHTLESKPPPSTPRMSDEERKRFLARKLRVSSASLRPPARSDTSLSSSPPPSREQLAEQLRRQLGGSKREEQQRLLAKHLAQAESAMAANDPVAASNALQLARALAPQDPEIERRLGEAQNLAAAALSDTYLRQAEYEEKSRRFDAAARSYERAARGKPSAEVWEAAARCLLEAGGDLRTAGDFARKSITISPERAASHLVLAQIFMAARMKTSAVTELERARRLDPNNDTVAVLLRRIDSNEF